MSEKTHFKKAFNSPYLGSQDLPDYKDINLTVEKVLLQGSEGLKENNNFNIAYFTDPKIKPMLLNATNSKILSKLCKSVYIEDWVNTEITLTVKTGIKAFGGIHDALRIREITRKSLKNLPVLNNKSKKWDELVLKVFEGAERAVIEKYYSVSEEVWGKLVKKGLEVQEASLELAKNIKQEEADKVLKEKERVEAKTNKFLDGED